MNRNNKSVLKHNQLVRVARLYYLCNMTHQEIAGQEGMSRIKVTRLLKEAVEKKIVEFNIMDPLLHTLELEEKIRKSFGLKTVILTPGPPVKEDLYDILGRFTADFLMRHLRNNIHIGIGWGRTLNGLLPYLTKTSCRNIKVISYENKIRLDLPITSNVNIFSSL